MAKKIYSTLQYRIMTIALTEKEYDFAYKYKNIVDGFRNIMAKKGIDKATIDVLLAEDSEPNFDLLTKALDRIGENIKKETRIMPLPHLPQTSSNSLSKCRSLTH